MSLPRVKHQYLIQQALVSEAKPPMLETKGPHICYNSDIGFSMEILI